VRTPRLLAS